MKEFGKYRLVAGLGRGGMAEVTLALEQGPIGFNKLVVIKRIRDHLAGDTEFVSMLIDEARLAARLNHPHIVNTTEVGEIDGVFYMAMEYLEGQPLSRVLRRGRKDDELPSLEIQVRIIADMLAGLDYAHKLTDFDGSPLNVVHRDVSPANVFVTYDGVVKVVDFGIAKAAGRVTETKTGVVKGKMTYIAPEQALGSPVDHRADLFSAGVMLWEAAVGRRMWHGVDEVAVLSKLLSEEWPRSPKETNPDTPDELDAICQRALAPDPNDRYADAEEFRAALDDWLDSLPKAPSQRTVAKHVSEKFEKERAQIKEIIEEQLSRLETGSQAGPLDIANMVASRDSIALTQSSLEIGAESQPQTNLSITRVKALERARTRSMVGMMIGLAAAAGVLIYVVTQGESKDDPVAAAPPTPAPAPAPSQAPAASQEAEPSSKLSGTIAVKLAAKPSGASFYIDDGPKLENPFVGKRKRDGEVHIVRVEAKGYKSEEHEVRFDDDVELDIELERGRTVAVVRHRVAATKPEPTPEPEPAPPPPPTSLIPKNSRPKTNVQIDRGDPWNQ